MSKRIGFVYRENNYGSQTMVRVLDMSDNVNEEFLYKTLGRMIVVFAESIFNIADDVWIKNKWIRPERYTYVKQSHRDIFSKLEATTIGEFKKDVENFYGDRIESYAL